MFNTRHIYRSSQTTKGLPTAGSTQMESSPGMSKYGEINFFYISRTQKISFSLEYFFYLLCQSIRLSLNIRKFRNQWDCFTIFVSLYAVLARKSYSRGTSQLRNYLKAVARTQLLIFQYSCSLNLQLDLIVSIYNLLDAKPAFSISSGGGPWICLLWDWSD